LESVGKFRTIVRYPQKKWFIYLSQYTLILYFGLFIFPLIIWIKNPTP
jgi:hypothetical protein